MKLSDLLRQLAGIVPGSSHGTPGRIMLLMILTALVGSAGLMAVSARLSEPAEKAEGPVIIMAKNDQDVTVSQVTDEEFAFKSTALTNPAKTRIANLAKEIGTDSEVVLIGYADARGSTVVNEAMAEGRAKAVRDALKLPKPPRVVGAGKRTANPACAILPASEQDACFSHDRRVEIWSRLKSTAPAKQ